MKLNRRRFIQLGVVSVIASQILSCSKDNASSQPVSIIEKKPNPGPDNLKIDNTITTIDSTLIFIG